uniref:Uncharacterized protein 5K14.4 n=1 Tax=Triticum monococcum TaxID=4568 RepID=Q5NKR0_TRIMO|nr:hypothetical protein [Triticum monococcum]
MEDEGNEVVEEIAKKIVSDMHYEARVDAVVKSDRRCRRRDHQALHCLRHRSEGSMHATAAKPAIADRRHRSKGQPLRLQPWAPPVTGPPAAPSRPSKDGPASRRLLQILDRTRHHTPWGPPHPGDARERRSLATAVGPQA